MLLILEHFVQEIILFHLKILIYIIPAVILGYYTDISIKRLKEYNKFGDNSLCYILLQTLIIIVTRYIFLAFFI